LRYRKQHPTDVVLGVAYLVIERGDQIAAVARKAGVSRPTVYRWVDQAWKHREELNEFMRNLRLAIEAFRALREKAPLPVQFVQNFRLAETTKPWLNVRWYLEHRDRLDRLRGK